MSRARCGVLLLLLLVPASYAIDFGPLRRVADLTPDAYAPMAVDAIAPDGKGGGVAFSHTGDLALVATPIDAAGVPHLEQAVTLIASVDGTAAVAARTPNGYLVGASDAGGAPLLFALNDDLSPAASPLPFGTDALTALACNGDVCAAATK